ncbi:MAG: restriction endonuclease [Bacteroidetes bacterium]|nr:restriction endonuclease [Bacteroidota bacterium]MCW5895447.1 restriction endonuclease [Bacteroidota bacterium]
MAKLNLKLKQAQPNTDKYLSFCDAAETILLKERKPLSHRDLAKKALQEKLIQTESKTPEISMHVSLRSEIRRREQRNEPQRFVFLGNGLFTLVELLTGAPAKKTQSAIEQVRQSRKEACDELYKRLTSKNQGDNFETMVADLLIALSYQNVEVIGGKDDQGVDILCEKRDGVTKMRVAIQCKCKKLENRIGPKDVSTLRDNLSTYQCQQGILITTSELNEDAKTKAKEAGKDPIHFIEHDEILDLFAEHNIGMRSEPVKYYQVDASQYEFLK